MVIDEDPMLESTFRDEIVVFSPEVRARSVVQELFSKVTACIPAGGKELFSIFAV